MTLPIFTPLDDPGPDFARLIRRLQVPMPAFADGRSSARGRHPVIPEYRHGTTVVALRFADGIVMAGDRRATEGHAIAHRAMEKVFPADRYSAVAIAGAAGPAVEMVRLFQTQLEHYEKVEGVVLSLEGKANQLSNMVREHLPMAMQGLAVVPLFAGYDLARGTGRIFTYDVTGGHYEETEHNATGSGGRDPTPPSNSGTGWGWPGTTPSSWPSSRSTRPPTRIPPPGDPTWCGGSTRWWPPSPPRVTRRSPKTTSPSGSPT